MTAVTVAHRPRTQADGDAGEHLLLAAGIRAFDAAVGPLAVTVTEDTLIEEELGVDALAMALVVTVLEDVFRVTVPDAIASRWRSVGDVLAWLDSNAAAERITS